MVCTEEIDDLNPYGEELDVFSAARKDLSDSESYSDYDSRSDSDSGPEFMGNLGRWLRDDLKEGYLKRRSVPSRRKKRAMGKLSGKEGVGRGGKGKGKRRRRVSRKAPDLGFRHKAPNQEEYVEEIDADAEQPTAVVRRIKKKRNTAQAAAQPVLNGEEAAEPAPVFKDHTVTKEKTPEPALDNEVEPALLANAKNLREKPAPTPSPTPPPERELENEPRPIVNAKRVKKKKGQPKKARTRGF